MTELEERVRALEEQVAALTEEVFAEEPEDEEEAILEQQHIALKARIRARRTA
jgi:hypothetical protein